MYTSLHIHGSFNKLLLQKEELEQKHVHLLQVVESEKTAKYHYTLQCEELSSEIKKLRNEVKIIIKNKIKKKTHSSAQKILNFVVEKYIFVFPLFFYVFNRIIIQLVRIIKDYR